MKKDSTLYVAIFMCIVSFAFVLPLSLANEFTKSAVAANKLFSSRKAVLDAFGLVYSSPEEAISIYDEAVTEVPGTPMSWQTTKEGAEHFAVEVTGPALWGSVTIIIASNKDVSILDGMTVLSQLETPGLGGRIDEAWFQNQFRDEKVSAEGITITTGTEALGKGDSDSENSIIDGITGASRTTDSIEALVNNGIAELRKIGGKAK